VCQNGWKTETDAATGDVRATVTQRGSEYLTLRSGAALPRAGSGGHHHPKYRIIIEKYGERAICLGFVRGWNIVVYASRSGPSTASGPVAFYTPAAVAGGFVEAPHAKMELRFEATSCGQKLEWAARPRAHCAHGSRFRRGAVPRRGGFRQWQHLALCRRLTERRRTLGVPCICRAKLLDLHSPGS
jgi:hypothetical protein